MNKNHSDIVIMLSKVSDHLGKIDYDNAFQELRDDFAELLDIVRTGRVSDYEHAVTVFKRAKQLLRLEADSRASSANSSALRDEMYNLCSGLEEVLRDMETEKQNFEEWREKNRRENDVFRSMTDDLAAEQGVLPAARLNALIDLYAHVGYILERLKTATEADYGELSSEVEKRGGKRSALVIMTLSKAMVISMQKSEPTPSTMMPKGKSDSKEKTPTPNQTEMDGMHDAPQAVS